MLWASVEMPAHFGAYREYWLHPHEFPAFNLVAAGLFVAGLWRLASARRTTTTH